VQQYLDDVETIVQQIPYFAAEHADDTWVFGDLTDENPGGHKQNGGSKAK
jgi:hypothetical protein